MGKSKKITDSLLEEILTPIEQPFKNFHQHENKQKNTSSYWMGIVPSLSARRYCHEFIELFYMYITAFPLEQHMQTNKNIHSMPTLKII